MTDEVVSRIRLLAGVPEDELGELRGLPVRAADATTEVTGAADAVVAVLAGVLVRRIENRAERYTSGDLVGLEAIAEPERREHSVWTDGPAQWVELPVAAVRALAGRSALVRQSLWRAVVARNRELEQALATAREDLADSRRQAQHDGLTHAFNRRWLDENLPRLLSRARPDRPLSVVMVDVDHFKRLNDTIGHAAGDRVLVAVADTLRRRFRPADLVARFGGEEFAVLMPGTTLEAAVKAAERVREAIAFTRFAGLDGATLPPVTVSCGVAVSREGDQAESLIRRADTALYRAKAAGRNRVVSSTGAHPE